MIIPLQHLLSRLHIAWCCVCGIVLPGQQIYCNKCWERAREKVISGGHDGKWLKLRRRRNRRNP